MFESKVHCRPNNLIFRNKNKVIGFMIYVTIQPLCIVFLAIAYLNSNMVDDTEICVYIGYIIILC